MSKLKPFLLIIAICFFVMGGYSQSKETDTAKYQKFFQIALDEIEQMLNGQKPLSFKRAVFLTENMYFGGTLNWKDFCKQIDQITVKLQKFIIDRKLQLYKTAGNYAIFAYMTDSIAENNFKPYSYDLYSYFGDDPNVPCFTVHWLLKTKKGNCHSMPYLYKILANEMNVEAHIALVPMHIYIRHRDEEGKWWNVELTTGSFSRTSWIIEAFNVSDEGIESGLYMKALSDKESVVECLSDMISWYKKRTGIFYDTLVMRACEVGIKANPISVMQCHKANLLTYHMEKAMEKKGLDPEKDYPKIKYYPDLKVMFDERQKVQKFIKEMGYATLTKEKYAERLLFVDEEREIEEAKAKEKEKNTAKSKNKK